ncbi:MAG: site-specific DNA-methyltransferase [Pseudomonadota bacterium]
MKSFQKLKTKLAELFQLDQADLDFGIYRIMNARRDEINRFLESDLLPQVREAFGEYKSSDKAEIQKELDKVVEGVKAAGMDPEQAPKVKELRARLAEEAVDVTALESEVYDHLYSFFSRYYDEGDFISLRRYKEGVYAIPYEGEEVKLHWANHDQYYIKTTEYFRDYAFKTPSGHRVHFKIAEADTEKDNIKAANGNDRRFLLHGDKPVVAENGELVIRFEYRPDGEKRRQDAINADTAKRVIADLNEEKLAVWKDRLAVMWKSAGGKEADKTILDKHLFDYTRRNTFDYFIHKDLGGFLRRELDFYIKNEVMRLDDIDEESVPRVEQYLSKIKVIRRIAHKIIDFLAQIENFQKKLWLKKKFVVETNYCVTLDRVPEDLYPEVAANDAQQKEWVRLFAIDEIKKDLIGAVDYSEPLTVEFLKANPFLVLDTRFFDEAFKARLLSSIENFDEQCDGLLIHSENFQALNLIKQNISKKVSNIFIDPPYNTGDDGFLYKDSYPSSTWLSMIDERITEGIKTLSDCGVFFVSIGDEEQEHLATLLRHNYGKNRFFANLIWEKKKKGSFLSGQIARMKDYILCVSGNPNTFTGLIGEIASDVETYPCVNASNPREIRRIKPGISSKYREKDFLRKAGSIISAGNMNLVLKSDLVIQDGALAKELVIEGNWRYSQDSMNEYAKKQELYITQDLYLRRIVNEPRYKRMKDLLPRLGNEGEYDFRAYDINDLGKYGWGTNEDANDELHQLLGEQYAVSYPKPSKLLTLLLSASRHTKGYWIDYFAGSGTTGHAVISLNREDDNKRKYILVEMGDYFDTVLKPRISKVVYSKNWKDGKPTARHSGISHCFKYLRLESYEDALANIELQRTGPQQLLLDNAEGFRESYMLKYMLDVESRGSQALLNIDNFDDPWNYKLLVGAGSVGETKPVNADLVETFNWLLGLKVKHIDRISGFQVAEGENPKGEKVLVIWRKVRDLGETDLEKIAAAREQANRDLEAFFRKQQYNTLDSEFDVIYVNGDNNLMNVPLDPGKEGVEPRYKVRLIEEEFKRLMFDVKDI